jgi:HK97 family phage prohead protease
METIRKLYNFEVKQLEGRVLRFTGSTETEDRDGEVIKVAGWQLENYKKNPVFMWAHDYTQPPIGKAVNVHKRNGALIFDVEFADKDTYEFADTIYKLYQGGFLHATSVGFIPDSQFITEGDGVKSPRRTYAKQELLELSAVPVPSNPDALRNAVALGISIKSITQVFGQKSLVDDIVNAPIVEKPDEPLAKVEEQHIKKEYSQQEIADEIDFVKSLVIENGLSDETKKQALELVAEIKRITGDDTPAGNMVVGVELRGIPELNEALNQATEIINNDRIKNIINQTVTHVINQI